MAEHLTDNDLRATHLHCFLYWEQKQPHAVFMTQPLGEGRVLRYTWCEVGDQVRRMAAWLRSLPPRSHVGIYGKNSAHWIMADLAIWMAGHVSVPLYPTLNAETARYVLEHGDVRALFIGKLDGKVDSWNQVKEIIPSDLTCIGLPLSPPFDCTSWDDVMRSTEPLHAYALPDPDDLATIMYTSGSTGLPKGVMHSFRSMMQVGRLAEQEFSLGRHDRVLSYLPLAHAAERAMVETTVLVGGGQLFFAHDLQSFMEDLRRARPTFFFSVPRLWVKFHQGINQKLPPAAQRWLFRVPVVRSAVKRRLLDELGLRHVRVAITGSAPLPAEILQWYRKLGLELLEGYAMTENFGYSHLNRPGDNRLGFVGYAQSGVDCRVSEEGEVLVRSPGTMLGYYKSPEKTAEDLMPDGFLKTGDRGTLDANGCLRLTGRIKDLFKTAKGKYIAPVPIELKLGATSLVEAACVGGCGLPQPVAFVMLAEEVRTALSHGSPNGQLNQELQKLLRDVNATLDPHEKLAFMVVVRDLWTMENGLLTPTLKIKRHAIEAHYALRLEAWSRLKQPVVWE